MTIKTDEDIGNFFIRNGGNIKQCNFLQNYYICCSNDWFLKHYLNFWDLNKKDILSKYLNPSVEEVIDIFNNKLKGSIKFQYGFDHFKNKKIGYGIGKAILKDLSYKSIIVTSKNYLMFDSITNDLSLLIKNIIQIKEFTI